MSRWPNESLPDVFETIDGDGIWAVSICHRGRQIDMTEDELQHAVDQLVNLLMSRAAAALESEAA